MATTNEAALSDYAFFKTGGKCNQLIAPSTIEELAESILLLSKNKTPYFVLGAGSNSLVSDAHFSGAVIVFTNLKKIEFEEGKIWAQAGVDNSDLSRLALKKGLCGAAWMFRLPGQLGGTIRMNARCYGGEISQIVKEVRCVMPNGQIETFSGDHVFKGYKDTVFMRNGAIIVDALIELGSGNLADEAKLMEHCERDRIEKQQFDHPSCGCVFKNNYQLGISSGLLLEEAGVKSFEHKGASVNPSHANFVFNRRATSDAIVELTLQMREAVYSKFGVWLEYEMEFLGEYEESLIAKVRQEKSSDGIKEDLLKPIRAKFQKNDC